MGIKEDGTTIGDLEATMGAAGFRGARAGKKLPESEPLEAPADGADIVFQTAPPPAETPKSAA